MNKRIFLIVVFCALVVLCALLLNNNQIDKSVLNKIIYNSQLIPLRDITNFKWDYAYLYTHNIDFQKIVFFDSNRKEIFSEQIELDNEGNILPQYLFDDDRKNVVYYKCSYNNGKIKFFRKEKLYLQDGFIYFYQPIDCDAKYFFQIQ